MDQPQDRPRGSGYRSLSAQDLSLQELNRLEARYAGRGRSLAELGPPQDLAERMVSTLPSPSPWDDLLGPFYGAGQIRSVLGNVSRQAVAERRQRHTLLGLKTADGQWVYPLFQFDRHNEVIQGLPELLQLLAASGVDDWSLAGWLMSPLRSLGRPNGHRMVAGRTRSRHPPRSRPRRCPPLRAMTRRQAVSLFVAARGSEGARGLSCAVAHHAEVCSAIEGRVRSRSHRDTTFESAPDRRSLIPGSFEPLSCGS